MKLENAILRDPSCRIRKSSCHTIGTSGHFLHVTKASQVSLLPHIRLIDSKDLCSSSTKKLGEGGLENVF